MKNKNVDSCKCTEHGEKECLGNKPQHTPTPWRIREHEAGKIEGGLWGKPFDLDHEVWLCSTLFKADLPFVERAVNAHEELVALIKDLRELTMTESGARTHMTLRVDQALARAEGK